MKKRGHPAAKNVWFVGKYIMQIDKKMEERKVGWHRSFSRTELTIQ